MSRPVCAVVLNYNGWGDTLECLDSLFACQDPELKVIVCDNGSTDGSLERIRAWARGEHVLTRPVDSPLASQPAYARFPIPHRLFRRGESELKQWSEPLLIIENNANLGFAGGCNPALRLLMEREDIAYVWLLNNDTAVAPGSPANLARHMETHPRMSLLGSVVLEYDKPGQVQALGGGRLRAWCAAAGALGQGEPWPRLGRAPLPTLDYIAGCAIFLKRETLRQLGAMDEAFFLYYEDVDWSLRARRLGPLDCCRDSLVYHKEGRSIGSSSRPADKERSRLSDYHSFKSRLIFGRKHYPWFLPLVALSFIAVAALRLRRGQWDRLGLIARALFGGALPAKQTSALDQKNAASASP